MLDVDAMLGHVCQMPDRPLDVHTLALWRCLVVSAQAARCTASACPALWWRAETTRRQAAWPSSGRRSGQGEEKRPTAPVPAHHAWRLACALQASMAHACLLCACLSTPLSSGIARDAPALLDAMPFVPVNLRALQARQPAHTLRLLPATPGVLGPLDGALPWHVGQLDVWLGQHCSRC